MPKSTRKRPTYDNRRSFPFIGEDNPMAKLKDEDIFVIRDLRKNKDVTQEDLAEFFGVHPTNISHIELRRTWSHLKQPK